MDRMNVGSTRVQHFRFTWQLSLRKRSELATKRWHSEFGSSVLSFLCVTITLPNYATVVRKWPISQWLQC